MSETARIPLTRGFFAVIDAADLPLAAVVAYLARWKHFGPLAVARIPRPSLLRDDVRLEDIPAGLRGAGCVADGSRRLMARRTFLPLPPAHETEGLAIAGRVSREEAALHFDALPADVLAGARLQDGRLLLEFPEALTIYPADPLAVRRAFVASAAEAVWAARRAPITRKAAA